MKRLSGIALTVCAVIALALGGASNVTATPPGNDGNLCHGANQETCRPDPQPSHGQDCDAHGNNPDGNDDHCGPTAQPTEVPTSEPSDSPSPTSEPTVTPSDEPSSEPTFTPSSQPTPSPVAPSSEPSATPSESSPAASVPASSPPISRPVLTMPPTDMADQGMEGSHQTTPPLDPFSFVLGLLLGGGTLAFAGAAKQRRYPS